MEPLAKLLPAVKNWFVISELNQVEMTPVPDPEFLNEER